jgi:hypothetical protein
MKGLARSDSLQLLGTPPLDAGDPAAAPATVDRIAQHRVSHVLQMHPNLMGTAGVQLQSEQIHHVEPGDHNGIRTGRSAAWRNGHPLPIL